MSSRSWNPKLVKIHRTYSVEEAASLFRVHKNTIREWLKKGLPTIDHRRPALILGSSLAEFVARRRRANKRPCSPGQIYCVRCRSPQHPAGNMAEYKEATVTSGNLIGICPICDGIIYRHVSLNKLDIARGHLEVTMPMAAQHIDESINLSLNRDFARE